jgi:hypothetical protein
MTAADFLRESFVSLEVNEDFTEAVLLLREGRLSFRHRVGERWVKAVGAGEAASGADLAGRVLSRIVTFRLNAKHLDIRFEDGSGWEVAFGDSERVR